MIRLPPWSHHKCRTRIADLTSKLGMGGLNFAWGICNEPEATYADELGFYVGLKTGIRRSQLFIVSLPASRNPRTEAVDGRR